MDATAVPKSPAVSDSRHGFWPIPTSLRSSVYLSRGTNAVPVGSAVSVQTMQGMLQKILNSSCTTAPFCKGSVWQFKRLIQKFWVLKWSVSVLQRHVQQCLWFMDATAVPKCPAVSNSRRGFWPIPTSLASSVYSSKEAKAVSVGSAVSLQTIQGMLQKILNSSCTTAPFCKGSVWQFKRLVQSSGFWSEACQFCTNIRFNNPRGSWMLPLFPSALLCPTVGMAFGPFQVWCIRSDKPKPCLYEVRCLFGVCKGQCKPAARRCG